MRNTDEMSRSEVLTSSEPEAGDNSDHERDNVFTAVLKNGSYAQGYIKSTESDFVLFCSDS